MTGDASSPGEGDRIRPVTSFDAAPLAALFDLCFSDQGWTESEVQRLLAMPGVFGRTMVDATAPFGCILMRQAADEGEILWLAVLPDRRRRGIAQALYRSACEDAVARGVGRLVLEVAEDNQSARAFYTSQGLRPVGARPDYYRRPNGSACDAVIMAAAISRLEGDGDTSG